MPFEINHVLTLFAPTYFANKTFFHMEGKRKALFSFFLKLQSRVEQNGYYVCTPFHAKCS